MTEKTCRTCGLILPITEFYHHLMMADGHLNHCKSCVKERVHRHRERNIDRIRAYDRSRGNRQSSSYRQELKARSPTKVAARTVVGNAVRDGKLTKPTHCQGCGDKHYRIHGHHEDYTRPLDVVWLCPACHSSLHAIRRRRAT